MSDENVIDYLNQKGWPYKTQGDEAILTCPFCAKPQKFYINTQSGLWQCWVCGEKGNLHNLKYRQGDWTPRPYIQHFSKSPGGSKKTFPVSEVDQYHQALLQDKEAQDKILNERGLNLETLKAFKIGLKIINGKKWISFPFLKNGRVLRIKYRSLEGKEFFSEKDGESILFGLQHVKGKDKILAVEGEYDCLAAFQLGYENVVSIPNGANVGKNVTPGEVSWLADLDEFREIAAAFDNDEEGARAALELSKKLGPWKVERWILPEKDFGDCVTTGLIKEKLDSLIQKKIYKDESIIHAKDLLDETGEFWRNAEILKGLQTRFLKLNQAIGGIREDELTVLTGDTGTGKTTFGVNLIEDFASKDIPCLIASTEMSPQKLVAKIFSIHSGKDFFNPLVFDEKKLLEEMVFWGQKPLYFVNARGSLDLERLQTLLSYAARIYGAKIVLLDHLHFFLNAKKADEERYEIERFMQGIVKSALENHLHIILICHPTKLDHDSARVGMNHLKGSARIKQDASNVLSLWRDRETETLDGEPNRVELIIPKVRDDSGAGGKVELLYDVNTRTYQEATGYPELKVNENGSRETRKRNPNIQYL